MTYVDGYLLVVPKNKLTAYKKMATLGGKVWKKHGALQYFECVGDDLNPKWCNLKFTKLMKTKKEEKIIFSFVIFKSKKHRDQVNKKVMNDPSMSPEKWKNKPMPFDMKRMAFGGFKTIVKK